MVCYKRRKHSTQRLISEFYVGDETTIMFILKFVLLILCLVKLSLSDVEFMVQPPMITKRDNLHHFMNDHELKYYFGDDHKTNRPDYEIIDLPMKLWNQKTDKNLPTSDSGDNSNDLNFEFQAFGRPFNLKLKQNEQLLSPNIKIVRRSSGNRSEVLSSGRNGIKSCHYLHADKSSVAALSNCYENEIVNKHEISK